MHRHQNRYALRGSAQGELYQFWCKYLLSWYLRWKKSGMSLLTPAFVSCAVWQEHTSDTTLFPGLSSNSNHSSVLSLFEVKSHSSQNQYNLPVLERVSRECDRREKSLPQALKTKTTSETCPASKTHSSESCLGLKTGWLQMPHSSHSLQDLGRMSLWDFCCECDRREMSRPQALKTKNDLRKVSSVENTL